MATYYVLRCGGCSPMWHPAACPAAPYHVSVVVVPPSAGPGTHGLLPNPLLKQANPCWLGGGVAWGVYLDEAGFIQVLSPAIYPSQPCSLNCLVLKLLLCRFHPSLKFTPSQITQNKEQSSCNLVRWGSEIIHSLELFNVFWTEAFEKLLSPLLKTVQNCTTAKISERKTIYTSNQKANYIFYVYKFQSINCVLFVALKLWDNASGTAASMIL